MFQLTKEEFDNLIFQIGTSSWGGRRKPPYVFTEQGVAMLSGVLHSERAIQVNIQIIRVFTKMREMILTRKDLLLKMEQLVKSVGKQDQKIALIFKYLKKFIDVQNKPRRQVGYKRKGNQ